MSRRLSISGSRVLRGGVAVLLTLPLAFVALAQNPPSDPLERAIDLAAKRRCDEAVPILNDLTPRVTAKDLKYRALMAAARCGIRQHDGRATVNSLLALRHDYPQDPEVLYLTTQVFLQIAVHASEDLAAIAPDSYQVLELEAETLESQGKWEEAGVIYKRILDKNPKLPNIHSRLGHVILTRPETAETNDAARREFEQELIIDPTNANAQFWIGEIARRQGKTADAIPYFNAALKVDPSLAEALLALGMAHNSTGNFSDAVSPLEEYVKKVPTDPAGHYQLALAYARTGRRDDSAREIALQQQLLQKKDTAPSQPVDSAPR
jgi:predicted Zn-dependent protease